MIAVHHFDIKQHSLKSRRNRRGCHMRAVPVLRMFLLPDAKAPPGTCMFDFLRRYLCFFRDLQKQTKSARTKIQESLIDFSHPLSQAPPTFPSPSSHPPIGVSTSRYLFASRRAQPRPMLHLQSQQRGRWRAIGSGHSVNGRRISKMVVWFAP